MKRDDVRKIDQIAIEQFGIPGIVLMENAGRGAAEIIRGFLGSTLSDRTITILCGPGNNGGDGYVIARHLQLFGFTVQLVSLVQLANLTGDAKTNADIAARSDIPIRIAESSDDLGECLPPSTAIVDCLLGTGAKGPPRPLYANAIRIANAYDVPRIAIDIPTGLDCDTGIPHEPTFQADLTITFVATKDGFANPDAFPLIGSVEIVPIGVPLKLLNEFA